MTDQGKYHGQRLTASDLQRLYATGERDFRGANLRGGNLRGADLSGADFSGADIRSTWFVEATLRSTLFCHARGGLQKRWLAGQLTLISLIATLTGFLQGYAGGWIGYYYTTGRPDHLAAAISGTLMVAAAFVALARQGFTFQTLESVAVAVAGAVTFAVTVAFDGTFAFAIAGAIAFASAVAVSFAGAVVSTVAGAGAGAVAVAGVVAVVSAVAGAVAVVGTRVVVNDVVTVALTGAVTVAGASVVASLLLLVYINRRLHQCDPKFENLRTIGLALATLGGTSFSGADLTDSTFAHAYLNGTNFADLRQRSTTLTQVRWHRAQKLDRARLGASNLQDPRVRILLITLNGTDQDLSHADLQGAHLAGANLHRANLKAANLNGATLAAAELHSAILTTAQCIGTDFTKAQLTGVCLEAWNIDETTILEDIDCQYVFLKERENHLGWRERLPHNPDKCFEPGDFEKYFREVLDEVKLLIRGGVDPRAFQEAFQELMRQHQITPESVRGLQRQGPDVLMSIAIPPDQSKPEVARTFDNTYANALPAFTTAQALLEAERQNKQEIIELANRSIDSISQILSNLTIHSTAMTNSNNPNITTGDGSFYAGRDVNLTGSTFNLGQISGQVSNQINQLPNATPGASQPSLKDLLTQLKVAVETDTELSDAEKAEALGEIAKLVQAGSNPQEGAMQRLAKRATATLKSIAETLSDTSKLATACQTLLPMVLALF